MDRPAGRSVRMRVVPKQLRRFTTVTNPVYPRQNLDAQRARSLWSSPNAAEDEHKVSLGLWLHAEPLRAAQARDLQAGRLQVLLTGLSLLELGKKASTGTLLGRVGTRDLQLSHFGASGKDQGVCNSPLENGKLERCSRVCHTQ